jgi:hypothetical protein
VTGLEDLEAAGIKVSGYDGQVTVFFAKADPNARIEVMDAIGKRLAKISRAKAQTVSLKIDSVEMVIVRITDVNGVHNAKLLMNN